ncbi:MAG: dihydroneopterin triphosphate diphosphatase [Gammaproteobacteria bacterium]|nr:dihydroneopterin triphosphate diphosphatase [Gammaproteobacteria bacterium]
MPPGVARSYKRPESVLVVVHTRGGQALLLKRADHPDFWQSVTGSLKPDEEPAAAAVRELFEETGIEAGDRLRDWHKTNRFEILACWRLRYAPGTTHNLEHVYSLELPAAVPVTLNPEEHSEYRWLVLGDALEKVWSWSNRAAIEALNQGKSAIYRAGPSP